MKKKFLFFVACLMAFSVQWSMAQTVSFDGGNGSVGSPWQISSPEQLALLKDYLGIEHSDKHFILTAEIDLEDYLKETGDGYNEGKGWEPIGFIKDKDQKSFCGVFDGDGYTVKGLWINRPNEEDGEYSGLFGAIQNATLKNITVEIDALGIKGYSAVGGLAGAAIQSSVIHNCFVSGGEISALSYYGGGLVGKVYDSTVEASAATVDLRVFEVLESPGRPVAEFGGLIGRVTDSEVKDCYATGDVIFGKSSGLYQKQSINFGGLIGGAYAETTISRCYATGNVGIGINRRPDGYYGGLLGGAWSKDVKVSGSYYNSDTKLRPVGGNAGASELGMVGKPGDEMSDPDSFNDWAFEGGKGTEGEPWQIHTPEQLSALRNYLGEAFKDNIFILGQDIDLTEYLSRGKPGYNGGKGWRPIGIYAEGDTEQAFCGTLKGEGFTISGLRIDMEAGEHVGLFAHTHGATLERVQVKLAEGGINGLAYVGGLAGSISGHTTVTGCSVTGEPLAAYQYAGGLIGATYESTVNMNFSMVDLQVLERAEGDNQVVDAPFGGLIGLVSASAISDCFSTGNIVLDNPEGSYEEQNLYLGGLVGEFASGSITRCYAAGTVAEKREEEENWAVGGLVGKDSEDDTEISSSYYNKDANEKGVGGDADQTGVVGKTEEQLRDPGTFEDWDLGEGGTWVIRDGETAPSFPWQKEEDLPLVKPYVEPVSYTIQLNLGGDILCNQAAGKLTMSEGDHLYLQFQTVDPTLTADDILFTVDGVETVLQDKNGNQFTYILNPITKDQEVVIALKEYYITLPEVEGVVTDPAAGKHRAAYGKPFTFTLMSDDDSMLDAARVWVNGVELPRMELKATRFTYTIDEVTEHITIEIEGIGDQTGTIGLTEAQIKISGDNGQLTIHNESAKAIDVEVYSLTGKRVVSVHALQGYRSFALPYGVYVVRAADSAVKVVVR
ncbi:GLUG motif-containing protein [Parabacteroides sp. PF5-6]|uniref:GLUG motif-containing protein n=1 Tax=Parabacteroides sp. PF5-6 TaxID=1742403 RepID=UPI002404F77B|nr:GLUG motif-containing protein [Parabacteroides sp. PF5-6]MDF9831534.1 hypothetical protein [Parabacteroides sp. PF5-6]